jgi:hypothetical protein
VARPSYKSEKRKKELARQKKQEEKRLRRFNKTPGQEAGVPDAATLEGLGLVPPPAADVPAADAPEAGAESEAADDDGPDGPEDAPEKDESSSGV